MLPDDGPHYSGVFTHRILPQRLRKHLLYEIRIQPFSGRDHRFLSVDDGRYLCGPFFRPDLDLLSGIAVVPERTLRLVPA
mgnify:CR=1 FL=1